MMMTAVVVMVIVDDADVFQPPSLPLPSVNEDGDDDSISVYVFGEEEEDMEREAKSNGGFVNFQRITSYYGFKNFHNVSEGEA